MDKVYEPLFTPWKIGNVEIKNRVVMVPMEGTNMIKWEAEAGFAKGIEKFYADRKDENIGLFIPGALPQVTLVTEKWLYEHPEVFEPVKPVVEEIHKSGAKIFFQLTAGPGRSTPLPSVLFPLMANKYVENAIQKLAPTKSWFVAPDEGEPSVWAPDKKMHQFTSKQIAHMVYAIGQTALLCKNAGVDGVEIHAVHEGYLLDQFAMPYTNHRTDAYGGSLENRLRFACEVVREIKKTCGEDYPVSLRYSVTSKTKGFNKGAVPGEDYTEAGRTREESAKAIKILEDAGYDMFNCDNGTYDAWYWAHPPVYAPLNMNLADVEYIKPFTTKPVVCAGKMQPEIAAASIAAGKIDAMGIGRQLLCDPEYITKLKEDRWEDIRPCIACHAACLPIGSTNGNGVDFDLTNIEMGRCALNPWTNRESEYSKAPATTKRKIAIVGGGIGGMEVAIQAALRGHTVDLYEKTDKLGGVFNAAAAPSFKEKDRELLKYYETQLNKSGATVHMNTEVSDIDTLNADVTVVAIGAKERKLNIPGAERAVTAVDALCGNVKVGDNVVIIGGGLTGAEIAYDLALQGKHPQVVEVLDWIVSGSGICAANSNMLRELLDFHKVPVYVNATSKEITADSVIVETPEGTKTLKADTVIMSVGYNPDKTFAPPEDTGVIAKVKGTVEKVPMVGSKLADKFPKKIEKVYCIGDCDSVGNLKTVIKQAYDLVQVLSYE